MSRILCLLSLFVCLNATDLKFEHWGEFQLKKDEKAYVIITYGDDIQRDTFEFSWTLYDDTNLVVHSKFRKYPRQIMLSLRRGLELYKQIILPNTKRVLDDEVAMYLEFKSYEKGIVTFMIYVNDNAKKVALEFYPNKGENG